MFYYTFELKPLFIGLRIGLRQFIIKRTKDELFSQRNGHWFAIRFGGYSFLTTRP